MTKKPKHPMESRTHWRTKEGVEVPIREMDDNHLCNTIRYIERSLVYAIERRTVRFLSTPGPDPDSVAAFEFNTEFDQFLETRWFHCLPPVHRALKKEARRRGLPDPSYSDAEMDTFEAKAAGMSLIALAKASHERNNN